MADKESAGTAGPLRRPGGPAGEVDAKYRILMETVTSGIIILDRGGRIQEFNPAAERMFGYSAEEAVGRHVGALIPAMGAGDDCIERYLEEGYGGRLDTGREIPGRRKDETEFPLDLTIREVQVDGRQLFAGVACETTLQKEAEASLAAAAAASEAANRMKSDFLNVISHELRTPLTVILGNAPLLSDPENLPDPEEIAAIAGEMAGEGQQLLTMINDLLDLASIEAGRLRLDLKPVRADTIVREVVASFRPAAHQKGIGLDREGDPPAILADPVRFKQVLFNLVSNAVKFTDRGRVLVAAHEQGGVVRFEVSDTGCGIAPEQLPWVFDLFRQVDSSATRAASGSGLGLAITRRLVEMHGGRIYAESTYGERSTFRFTMPVWAPESASAPDGGEAGDGSRR